MNSIVSPAFHRLTITAENILNRLPQTKEQLVKTFCGKQDKLAAKLESRLGRLIQQKKIVLIGAFYYGSGDNRIQEAAVSQPDQPEQVPGGSDGILLDVPCGEQVTQASTN